MRLFPVIIILFSLYNVEAKSFAHQQGDGYSMSQQQQQQQQQMYQQMQQEQQRIQQQVQQQQQQMEQLRQQQQLQQQQLAQQQQQILQQNQQAQQQQVQQQRTTLQQKQQRQQQQQQERQISLLWLGQSQETQQRQQEQGRLQEEIQQEAAKQGNYTRMDSTVIIPFSIQPFVMTIATNFKEATGTQLVVTDGYRTVANQATQMYPYMVQDQGSIYGTGPAATAVRSAFNAAYDPGLLEAERRAAALAAMQTAIQQQLNANAPISPHLLERGVDFRTRDLSPQHYTLLLTQIHEAGGTVLLHIGEREHFHVTAPKPVSLE